MGVAKCDHGKCDHCKCDHCKCDHGKCDHGKCDHGKYDHGKCDYGKWDHLGNGIKLTQIKTSPKMSLNRKIVNCQKINCSKNCLPSKLQLLDMCRADCILENKLKLRKNRKSMQYMSFQAVSTLRPK